MGGGNIVTTNNATVNPQTLDSRGRRAEQGTNFTLDITTPIKGDPSIAQAPIQPYTGAKPDGYVARKSNTLLGNAQKSRISRKYYRNLAVGEGADSILNSPPNPQLPPG